MITPEYTSPTAVGFAAAFLPCGECAPEICQRQIGIRQPLDVGARFFLTPFRLAVAYHGKTSSKSIRRTRSSRFSHTATRIWRQDGTGQHFRLQSHVVRGRMGVWQLMRNPKRIRQRWRSDGWVDCGAVRHGRRPLTAAERKASAQKAALARWSKKKKKA